MADDLPHFKAFVLGRPCQAQPCVMAPQFHHAQHGETFAPWARPPKALPGKRGKGQRASDWYGIGLCFACHGDLHDLKGQFRQFTNADSRIWMDERIAENQRAYAMAHPEMIGAPVAAPRKARKTRTPGKGWTVAGVLSWLRQEARVRPADVGAAFSEFADLIESDVK